MGRDLSRRDKIYWVERETEGLEGRKGDAGSWYSAGEVGVGFKCKVAFRKQGVELPEACTGRHTHGVPLSLLQPRDALLIGTINSTANCPVKNNGTYLTITPDLLQFLWTSLRSM